MTEHKSFSRGHRRGDLVRGLPQLGMILGPTAGGLLGWLDGASVVSYAAIGFAAGVVLGWLLRIAFGGGG